MIFVHLINFILYVAASLHKAVVSKLRPNSQTVKQANSTFSTSSRLGLKRTLPNSSVAARSLANQTFGGKKTAGRKIDFALL